jgi:hypothetical protein
VNSARPRPASPLLPADASGNTLPGRLCPADYRYDPAVFDREPEMAAEVLYVVGGLYGNEAALAAIEEMADAERAPVTVVFNGDFHWFDAEPAWFAEIERRVERHPATRGNVETEIARRDDIGAGCGCAYPEMVDDTTVARSNEMLRHLRRVASEVAAPPRLAALPMHLVTTVGDVRVGIVHGDAVALAGWRFAADALDDPASRAWLGEVRARARIEVFASTHTCAAALRAFTLPAGSLTVINNGAAGMPNFAGTQFGLISRIGKRPSPHPPLYGIARDGVFIDALPVAYDTAAFLARFLARWPAGSAAHQSYFRRIVEGPDHTVAAARPA